MNCVKCAAVIPDHEQYEHAGRILCEDCYIDAVSVPKTCDPWAVFTAKNPMSKGDTLTEDQQRILSLIKSRGPLTLEQICSELILSEQDFRSNFSTLRHMALAQACQTNGKVCFIPFGELPG